MAHGTWVSGWDYLHFVTPSDVASFAAFKIQFTWIYALSVNACKKLGLVASVTYFNDQVPRDLSCLLNGCFEGSRERGRRTWLTHPVLHFYFSPVSDVHQEMWCRDLEASNQSLKDVFGWEHNSKDPFNKMETLPQSISSLLKGKFQGIPSRTLS